jgi:hypothetical protein
MKESPASEVRWQELTKSECFNLLAREHLGRVAFVDDLGPLVVPVNFVLDRHMVVFRTGEGTKLDAAIRRSAELAGQGSDRPASGTAMRSKNTSRTSTSTTSR